MGSLNLEVERKRLELKRVQMSGDEMRFKIMERQADIDRLNKEIENQEARAKEIEKWLTKN